MILKFLSKDNFRKVLFEISIEFLLDYFSDIHSRKRETYSISKTFGGTNVG